LHSKASDPITPYSVQEIGGVVPDAALAQLVSALGVELTNGKGEDGQGDVEMRDAGSGGAGLKLNKSTKDGFNKVRTQVEKIVRDGYSATQILTQVRLPKPFLLVLYERRLTSPICSYTTFSS